MSSYKLIALDMDGTLLNTEQEISKANQMAVNEAMEAGITVCLSTGRGIRDVLPYLEQLGLNTPMVCVNGGDVWKEPNVLLSRHQLEISTVKEMHALATKHDVWFWAYAVEAELNAGNWGGLDVDAYEWLKFGFYTEDGMKRKQIVDIIQDWGTLEMTNSHPYNLELNPKGINKASGLQEVCQMLGIEMSQVVSMGDSLNDIAMIRASGLGVAMGNAQEEIKQAADLVTVTNNEDGVAKVIREMVLKS